MGLQMGGINHQRVCCITFGSQFGQDVREDTHSGPSGPSDVERLVWPVLSRCITPTAAISNNMDDATEDLSVVRPSNPSWLWEHVFYAVEALLVEPIQMRHG